MKNLIDDDLEKSESDSEAESDNDESNEQFC